MVVKPIVYNARACENDVSCFTLSFCAPFVTKLTDVRRQNAKRPSPRRRTSAIFIPSERRFFTKRVLFTLFLEKSF